MMMWKDAIVEELHAMRQAHAAKFGFDSQKIFNELKEHEAVMRAQGWQFVDAAVKPAPQMLGDGSSGALAH
jgi:hypothetical protein